MEEIKRGGRESHEKVEKICIGRKRKSVKKRDIEERNE